MKKREKWKYLIEDLSSFVKMYVCLNQLRAEKKIGKQAEGGEGNRRSCCFFQSAACRGYDILLYPPRRPDTS
jgi:hypothetical protein